MSNHISCQILNVQWRDTNQFPIGRIARGLHQRNLVRKNTIGPIIIIIYSTPKVITEKITENQTSRHIKSQNWIKRTGKLRTRCQTQKNVKSIKRNKYINERGTFNSNNKSLVDQSATIDHRPSTGTDLSTQYKSTL